MEDDLLTAMAEIHEERMAICEESGVEAGEAELIAAREALEYYESRRAK